MAPIPTIGFPKTSAASSLPDHSFRCSPSSNTAQRSSCSDAVANILQQDGFIPSTNGINGVTIAVAAGVLFFLLHVIAISILRPRAEGYDTEKGFKRVKAGGPQMNLKRPRSRWERRLCERYQIATKKLARARNRTRPPATSLVLSERTPLIQRPSRLPIEPACGVQFFVRNVAGKTLTFLLNPLDLVSHVKEMIYAKDGCPCDKQRLIYAGKQLEDDRTLADYWIMRQSTIFLVYSLRGGGDNSESCFLDHLHETADIAFSTNSNPCQAARRLATVGNRTGFDLHFPDAKSYQRV